MTPAPVINDDWLEYDGRSAFIGSGNPAQVAAAILVRPGSWVKHVTLAESIWQDEFAPDNSVRQAISRLRQSLRGDIPELAEAIENKRGRVRITPIWCHKDCHKTRHEHRHSNSAAVCDNSRVVGD